jgi:hypothetical protein
MLIGPQPLAAANVGAVDILARFARRSDLCGQQGAYAKAGKRDHDDGQ